MAPECKIDQYYTLKEILDKQETCIGTQLFDYLTDYKKSENIMDGGFDKTFDETFNKLFQQIICKEIKIDDDNGFKLLQLLIKKGINVNKNIPGLIECYLNIAVASNRSKRRYDIIKLLLDSGALLSGQTHFNPLHCVCLIRQEHITGEIQHIIDLFLEKGVDINVKNFENATPLQMSALYDNVLTENIMKVLLSRGADATNICCDGGTALHLSVKKPNSDLALKKIKLLIEAGTNVNISNHQGDTVAHLAAKHFGPNAGDIITFLAQNKADLFLKNRRGMSAYDLLDSSIVNNYSLTIKSSVTVATVCYICLDHCSGIMCNYGHNICCECLAAMKGNNLECHICANKLNCEVSVSANPASCLRSSITFASC